MTLRPRSNNVTEGDLIAFCRENMAHFKAPKTVVFGPLPKTSTGKVQKFKLREQAGDCDRAATPAALKRPVELREESLQRLGSKPESSISTSTTGSRSSAMRRSRSSESVISTFPGAPTTEIDRPSTTNVAGATAWTSERRNSAWVMVISRCRRVVPIARQIPRFSA